jgi:predicted RNA binding protein YcfA (HicA-like mRNA interferase family)
VSKAAKTIAQIIWKRADANIRFDELRGALRHLGFAERIRGSHHSFSRPGVEQLINLQRDGSHAKAYQVRQVRAILLQHGLATETRP